jgi:hypothetical protein
VWLNVWPAIAGCAGLPGGEPRLRGARQGDPPAGAEWAAICAAHGLKSPPGEFVGLSSEYADYTMGYGRDRPGPPRSVSTVKLMQVVTASTRSWTPRRCSGWRSPPTAKRLPPRP